MPKIDLTGTCSGKLTVMREVVQVGYNRMWECLCSCGNTVVVRQGSLRDQHTKSCGSCKPPVKKDPAYTSYRSMLIRCLNPKHVSYKDYGERGISVCSEWVGSFKNFIRDMGARPPGFQLDRIDNSKGYHPENCRWVAPRDNSRNRRRSVYLTCDGVTLHIREWADKLHLSYSTLEGRRERGWTDIEILTTPIRRNRGNRNR